MGNFERIQSRETGLHKKLSAGQMSMIAIGGAIGTGLFLGSKFAIGFAGPAVIISYALGGMIALALMGCLAEMTVQHPTSGSFGAYAEFYLHPLAGFLVRYSYWACIVLAVGTEVTAIAEYMKFWFPRVDSWIWIALFSCCLIGVNAYSVKAFGSVEYWFSTIKIFAIIVFIVLAISVLLTQSSISRIEQNMFSSGFAPHGFSGIWTGVIISIFSYLGIEMIAIAAGEATNPEQAVKTAFKGTFARLLIFYLLALSLIVMLVPWQELIKEGSTSPFVSVMKNVGIPFADSILNFIVIVAALSAMNSMLYIATRMMFSLSRANEAPQIFGKVKSNGVPLNALALSSAGIAVAALVYILNPETAFPVMIALSMFGALFSWGAVFLTHLCFRIRMQRQQQKLKFRVPGFPFVTIAGLLAIISIMITTWFTPIFHATLLFGVPFLVFLILAYFIQIYHKKYK
ncbi:amino acid permease [Snodgrassella alvi]|uniref:amino acid permease n=1 Tax=Snodgrassella alvi TaxID=1196083 RepID=UPI000C1F5688|nr:amino acid permease [Snodgrassella alvi]PIT34669.1 amino acid permease [Snodgrassella alvi]PIT35842.1 amino acid permease [Snodgrassella alvi]WLT05220.1 amino acid permease [Snodgrassella alvi]